MQYFSIDAGQCGILGSSYYIAYTIAQIPAGIIVDRYNIRYTATIAIALCAIGLALFVSTTNFHLACLGQMIVGLTSAFAFIATVKTVTEWFPLEKRAMMTSCTISIGCMGPVIFGPSVAHIAENFYWKNVILIFAGFGLILAVAAWCVVRSRKDHTDARDTEPKEHVPISTIVKTLTTSPQIWILSLLTLAQYAPLSALGDMWGAVFIKTAYNVSYTEASAANNMLYAGMIVGPLAFAYIATRLGSYKKAIILGIVMCTLSFSAIEFCSNLRLEAVFALLLVVGFSAGAMLAYQLGTIMYPNYMAGIVVSIINMASMISGIILMPMVGALMKLSWNGAMENGLEIYSAADYRCGFLSVLVSLAIGTVLAFFVKDHRPEIDGKVSELSKK